MNYVTVSFLNLFCYVLWGAARYMGHPQLTPATWAIPN